MASIRRSRRSSTQTKKYKEVDSDDENDKLAALLGDESGSDFEKDFKKKKSNGFLDPKISSSSSSEEISDENISEESADEDSVKIKKKNSNVANRKKVTDGRKLMKQRETLLEEKVKNKMKTNGLPVYFKKTTPKINSMPTNKGLSLSESSSSEDENEKPSQNLTKITAKKIKSPLMPLQQLFNQIKTSLMMKKKKLLISLLNWNPLPNLKELNQKILMFQKPRKKSTGL